MLMIDIDPGLREMEKALGPDFRKQLRFAMSRALTSVAFDARTALNAQLGESFTMRSTWVPRGMRVTKARKSSLVAEVGNVRAFMVLHAEGGRKEARDGGDVAIPHGARPTPRAKTTRAKHPGRMLRKPRHFVQTVRGKRGVWRRKTKKRYPIQRLWQFAESVQVKKTWRFEDQVLERVRLSWPSRARQAIDYAIKTARPKR